MKRTAMHRIFFRVLSAGIVFLCATELSARFHNADDQPLLYAVDYSSVTTSGLGSLSSDPDGAQTTRTSTLCTLEIWTASETKNSSSVLTVKIRDVQFHCSVNDIQQREYSERISAEMRSVSIVHLDSTGAILTMDMSPILSSDAKSIIISLLCVLSGDLKRSTSSLELPSVSMNDRLGTFRSIAVPRKDIEHNSEESIRRGYMLADGASEWKTGYIRQNNSMTGVSQSHFDAATRLLNEREVRDTQLVRFAAQVILRCTSKWSMKRILSHRVHTSVRPHITSSQIQSIHLPEVFSDSLTTYEAMQQVRGSSTSAGVLDTLRRLPSLDSSTREGIEPKLRAVLYLDSTVNDSLAGYIHSLDLSDSRLQLIASILCFSPHQRSQTVMMELLNKVQAHASQEALLIPYLSEIKHPLRVTIERLVRAMVDDSAAFVRSTAALCFGSMIHTQRSENPRLSDSLLDILNAHCHHMGTELYLSCLGNAGHRLSLDSITHYLAADDVQIRERALRALRFIPGRDVDSIVNHSISLDSAAEQQSALSTVAYRRPSSALVQGLCTMILHGCDSSSTEFAMQTMLRWTYDMPCVDEESCVQFWIATSLDQLNATSEQRALFQSLLRVE